MGRIEHAFRLLGASWQVLKKDRELIVLPVISGVLTLVVAASFMFAAFSNVPDPETFQPTTGHYVLLGIFYFVAYFISIFFNAAVVAAAMMRLNGEDPTVRDGLQRALEKLGKIAGWALIAASVGLVLRFLEERAGGFGRFVVGLLGAAWSVITFFVVPVILFEPETAGGSIKRSASLFRARWGETMVGSGGIGLAMFFVAIPVVMLAAVVASASPLVGIVFGVVAVGAIVSVGAALSGIYSAALYRFAVAGEASGPFGTADLHGAFRPKRRGLFGGN